MNILKYLLPCIALLIFVASGVQAGDGDKKKYLDKDGKKYHEKMWGKKDKWKQCPMMGMGPPPVMGTEGPFTMIEAQGGLFLYNKSTGDVWACNAFKKTCEQIVVENKDIE